MLQRLYFPLTLAALVFGPMAYAKPADEAAILKIERDMAEAQTADQALVAWDENAVLDDLLTTTPPTAEFVGLPAIRADVGSQLAGMSNIHAEILQIVVKADGKLGFAHSVQRFTGKAKDGSNIELVFRESDCFEKKKGRWLLVHQHLSVPFDPATGKAVFNSK